MKSGDIVRFKQGKGDYLYFVIEIKKNEVKIDRCDFPGIVVWVHISDLQLIRHARPKRWNSNKFLYADSSK